MNVGEFEREVYAWLDRPVLVDVDIIGQRLALPGILQLDSITVAVPVPPALPPVDAMHVLVRGGIVRRHRRTVRIVRIEVSTAWIDLDTVISHAPSRIGVPLGDDLVRLAIGLKSVPCARASVECHRRQYECDRNRPRGLMAIEVHFG